MLTKKQILHNLEQRPGKFKRFGVKKLGLFGSFAGGLQSKHSDIDFLVEFDSKCKTFDNYMDLKLSLESTFKRRVDLVISGSEKPRLKPRIHAEVIYARL